MTKRIAIIGGGPAGCSCAYFALQNADLDVTIYDDKPLMTTILPTGNGRCNLTYAEYDFRELVKFYPRGEKFLYSVFSQFSVSDTLQLFDDLCITTYMQDDFRFFPVSNSSKTVKKAFTDKLNSFSNFHFIDEKVYDIKEVTDNYDYVVIATGSSNNILNQLNELGQKIIPFKQSLVALKVKQNFLYQLPGVVLKNVSVKLKEHVLTDDILITHSTLSGPLIYKISSIMAFENLPYTVSLNLTEFGDVDDFDKYFEQMIKKNNNKNLLNVVSKFVPLSFAQLIFAHLHIDIELKCNQTSKFIRHSIAKQLSQFNIDVTGTKKYGETVKAGGVNTDFINPKSMQSKTIPNLFIVGEILNIDGFCGGFNLQNCWSTGAICGQYLSKIKLKLV